MTGVPLRPPRRRKRTDSYRKRPPGVMFTTLDVTFGTTVYRTGLLTNGEAWWTIIAKITGDGERQPVRGPHWRLAAELDDAQRGRLISGDTTPLAMLQEVFAAFWPLSPSTRRSLGWDGDSADPWGMRREPEHPPGTHRKTSRNGHRP